MATATIPLKGSASMESKKVRIFSTLWYTPPKGLSKTARITFDNPAIIPRILAINAGHSCFSVFYIVSGLTLIRY